MAGRNPTVTNTRRIQALRCQAESTMVDRCTIFGWRDTAGENVTQTNVALQWLTPGASGSRSKEDARPVDRGQYQPRFAWSTDIRPGDMVTFGGRKYEVVFAPAPAASDADRAVGLNDHI